MDSDEVDRLVLDILSETHDDVNEDARLCGEIADELQEDHEIDGQMVSNSLHRLFNQGRVVKSITHQRPGLSARGSFVRWALTSAPFFPPTSKEVIDMEKSLRRRSHTRQHRNRHEKRSERHRPPLERRR